MKLQRMSARRVGRCSVRDPQQSHFQNVFPLPNLVLASNPRGFIIIIIPMWPRSWNCVGRRPEILTARRWETD